MKMLSSPISSAISTLAPSSVPMMSAPFIANFMLLVPEASVPEEEEGGGGASVLMSMVVE